MIIKNNLKISTE